MPGRSLAFIEADFERVDRAEKRLEAVTRRTRAGSWRPTPQRKPAQESPVPASLLRLDLHAPAVGVGATITDMRTEAEAVVSARTVASKEDALRQSQAMARVAATAPVSPSDDVSQYQDGQGPRTAVPAAAPRPAARNGPGRPAPLSSKPPAPQPRAPTLLGPNFLFGPGGRAFPHRNVPQVAVVSEPAAATETVGEAPDAWANPLLQSPDSTGPSPRVGSVLTSPQKRRERAAADARRLERFVNQSPIRLRRPASGQSRPPKAAQPGDMNFDRMATNFFRSLPPAVPPHSRPATAHRAVSAVSRRDSVPKQHRTRPSSAALWDGSASALRAPVVAPADTAKLRAQSPAPDAAPLEPDFYYLHVRLAHAHGQGMGNWVFTLTVTDVTPGAVPRSHSVANLRVNREGHLVFHPPHGVILSPCDDIPWVARPEDMYLRTLRLEVVSTYPTSSKVLESMVYYGDAVPGGSA